MSINSEITRINSNISSTYAKLEALGATLPEVKNSDNLPDTASTITTGTIYELGKSAEREAFWESFQQGGAILDAAQMFAGYGWNDDVYNPKYPIYAERCLRLYHMSQITDTKVPIVVGAGLDGDEIKSRLTGNLMSNTFVYSKVEIIRDLWINRGIKFDNTFTNVTTLKHMKITGHIGREGFDISSCTLISPDTIQSVLEACGYDFTGATSLVITLPSTCSDYLLDNTLLDERGFPELRQVDDEGNTYNTIDIINKYPDILAAYNAAIALNYTISFN